MPRPPSRLKRTMKVYRAVGEEVLGPLGFEWQKPDWLEQWWRTHPSGTAIQAIRLKSWSRPQHSLRLLADVGIYFPPIKAAVRAVRGDDLWTFREPPPGFFCPLWLAVLNASAPPVSSPKERVAFQMREADNVDEELIDPSRK